PLRALIERGRALLLTGLIVVCLFPVTRGFAQEETDTAYFRNVSAKLILECFKQAREAVLLQDAVLCWPSGTGRAYLDRKTPQPETEDVETICKNARAAPGADRRVLDRRVINDVISLAKNAVIDTRGIRIIGGIYCSTIDLTGIDIPYSLVLDRSIVWGGNIETRNFRTGGDFSVD
ncbi:MAG: hypothetical protein ACJ8FK_12040, partial [Xanthobacteraceae bacterium]